MIETDVFSLMLACICHNSCDTADLEIAVHLRSLQAASPACLRNKREVGGERQGV